MSFLTTDEAAQRLGITPRRVVQLLNQRLLDGRQVQRDWLVSATSVRQREAVTTARGRPMTPQTARALIEALDNGTSLPARRGDLMRSRNAELLSSAIAHAVSVETFMTRNPQLVLERLYLTAESALQRLTTGAGESLAGQSQQIHGYPRDSSLEDLIDDAMMVRSDEGTVHVYQFRDGLFPWEETPAAMIAVDSARSASSRVRAAGIEALEKKRDQWLASHTR